MISLQSSATGNFDEQYRFHQFSITVSLIPDQRLKTTGPLIQIEPEEYIIGSLDDSDRIKNGDMYEYYQVNIPYDANKVEFDWQSDSAILLVNVGETRPTIDNANFTKVARSDTVFEITNEEILRELKAGNYIKNAFLTIGVYTENLETNYGTAYSFRVHFSKNLNIYKVNSDQKTLCKPDYIGSNEYRCLFMITYGELDFIYDLMIYSKSQSPSATTYMYGDFIQKDIYDRFDIGNLQTIIPKDGTSAFNTKNEKIDFIFLTLSDTNSHFYVSVISDQPDILKHLTQN